MERQRVRRRWFLGYAAVLLTTLPAALPCWNAFLKETVGRVLSIQAIHVVEYLGLGLLGAWYRRASEQPRRALVRVLVLVLAVGLADELVQGLLPQRLFEWSDVWLNWCGGVGGVGAGELAGWLSWKRRRAAAPSKESSD